MSFLPIVERELRVASRRKSTFVIRWAGAAAALGLAGIPALFTLMSPGQVAGKYVFQWVSFYVFVFALLGGIFLAADCLSSERREGTLGFLFLTDLKGYDVVLGKFLAISLNAFYGLLAVVPILGLSLLAGGVTGAEFWRMSLALINTLFFSLTVAVLVSSRTVASYRATVGSVCVLIVLIAVAQLARACSGLVPAKYSALLQYLGMPCPLEPFLLADDAGYRYQAHNFWLSLALTNFLGWIFLGLAAWSLPRLVSADEEKSFKGRLLGKLSARWSRRRSALLDVNPVLWWLGDAHGMKWVAWVIAGVGAVILVFISLTGPGSGAVAPYVSWPFFFLLKLFFAIQATRFFSEARRTGSLELINSTPLTMPIILNGQWLALRKLFLWPVIFLTAVEFGCAMSAKNIAARDSSAMLLLLIWGFGKTVGDFFAAGWFGMWLALNGKKPEMAAGLTILFVLILPLFAFCIPTFVIDIVFIVTAREKLLRRPKNPSLVLGGKPGH